MKSQHPKTPIVFCWSGGKDSAYALYRLLQNESYEVRYLLSTFNAAYKRLSMHGVRESLIETQAKNIGIPLIKVFTTNGSNKEYEDKMLRALTLLKKEGINTIAFGDIFLQDLRAYREAQNKKADMQSIFPLWEMDTKEIIQDFFNQGFKTITCCIHTGSLQKKFCGKIIDEDFIAALPPAVDACGENGEYHSFCFDGPLFKTAVPFKKGVLKYSALAMKENDENATAGFWYCDLLPID